MWRSWCLAESGTSSPPSMLRSWDAAIRRNRIVFRAVSNGFSDMPIDRKEDSYDDTCAASLLVAKAKSRVGGGFRPGGYAQCTVTIARSGGCPNARNPNVADPCDRRIV